MGLIIRRTPEKAFRRLALRRVNLRQAAYAAVLALILLALSYATSWVGPAVQARTKGATLDALAGTVYAGGPVWQALVIALVAGASKEIFFRGALQPRFSAILTIILFTILYLHPGSLLGTLMVCLGAFASAWLRDRTNTTTCILLQVLNACGQLLLLPRLP